MATIAKTEEVAIGIRRRHLWALVACLLLAMACAPNDTYEKMHTIDRYEWYRTDTLDFEVAVDDTAALYDLSITFRHNDDYPFSNLWFNLHTTYPTGKTGSLRKQIKLADNQSLEWMGDCMGNICSVKVPIVQDLHLSQAGQYHFRISHVMRTNPLPGVMDVGLHLKKRPAADIVPADTTAAEEKKDGQPKPVIP